MGKKSKKITRKKSPGVEEDLDYEWLLQNPSSTDAGSSSSKQGANLSKSVANSPKSVAESPVLPVNQVSVEEPLLSTSVSDALVSGEVGNSVAVVVTANNSSPSVSCTLGSEDSGSGLNVESHKSETLPTPEHPVPNNATWAGLFKDNRKMDAAMLLTECLEEGDKINLNSEDIDIIEEAWGFGLIGYVAGKFPGKGAIDHCCRAWGVKVKLHFHSSGWLLFKFNSSVDRDFVLSQGPYYIYGRPLLLKIMPDVFNFNDSAISSVPIWLQLPNLPLEFWNVRALSKIASKLGVPKQADKLTISRDRVSFARVLVEVDITKPLKREVCITVPNGKELIQPVWYEYIPKFCPECKAIGHLSDKCPYAKTVSNAVKPAAVRPVPAVPAFDITVPDVHIAVPGASGSVIAPAIGSFPAADSVIAVPAVDSVIAPAVGPVSAIGPVSAAASVSATVIPAPLIAPVTADITRPVVNGSELDSMDEPLSVFTEVVRRRKGKEKLLVESVPGPEQDAQIRKSNRKVATLHAVRFKSYVKKKGSSLPQPQ